MRMKYKCFSFGVICGWYDLGCDFLSSFTQLCFAQLFCIWYKPGKRFIGLSSAEVWEIKVAFCCPALYLVVLRSLGFNSINLHFCCSNLQTILPSTIAGSVLCFLTKGNGLCAHSLVYTVVKSCYSVLHVQPLPMRTGDWHMTALINWSVLTIKKASASWAAKINSSQDETFASLGFLPCLFSTVMLSFSFSLKLPWTIPLSQIVPYGVWNTGRSAQRQVDKQLSCTATDPADLVLHP